MLPALRLGALTLGALLLPATAAQAALSVPVPAEAQVSVVVGTGLKSIKVKSAPAGVTVAGGVKRGRFAVAVVRPRGAGAGKVSLSVKGRAKGVKTFRSALSGGKAGAACSTLPGLLRKRLKGSTDMKALASIIAAKLCGKRAPAGADTTLARLGFGASQLPLPGPGTSPGGSLSRPGSSPGSGPVAPTPPPPPPGKRACDNGIDDDGDGQTDWEDPGCEHAGDNSEEGEVPVSAECAASSGISMGDETTGLYVGINSGCGMFVEVEIDVAPGIESCQVFTADSNFKCEVFAPTAHAWAKDDRATDLADVLLTLVAPADCGKLTTIALHRPNGEVAELREPIESCKTGPAPKPACSNGKDDDGDGMIDARDAAGVTDPDPGCSGPGDRSEDSEVPTPATCDVQIGLFDGNPRLPGLIAEGCGVLKGVWFKPPGTPVGCAFALIGDEDALECLVRGGVAEAAYPLTNRGVLLAAPIAANAACGKVTVALVREDDSVMADRVDWC
jgi:hypothetical protein